MPKKRTDGYLKRSFTIEGKRYYVYGKNQKELLEKEVAKRVEVETGIERHDNPTVTEYYDRWSYDRAGTVSEATIRTQAKIFNIVKDVRIPDLNRSFGELKMQSVTIDDLRVVQRELRSTRKTQTVNDYMALIKHILADAKRERILEYNPGEMLKNLKRTEEKARDTHHRALSIEEQDAFFGSERCQKSYYYNVFRFAILTGMRIGEIGALKYSDIKNDIINVERTITRTETGSYIVGDDAKTQAGRRVIPINPVLNDVIASQKELNKLLDGNLKSSNELLFRACERGLLMATPIDREIKKICEEAGVTPFTMHALRATFATRAIESGMNPKTLQEILGHSNFNLTMSLYGHCLTDTKKLEMNSVNIKV
ncbi:MAG: site-specific integrase [Firmicutes bacterium]|nr:site-specific integrase [Bacillota bacterium]